MKHLATILFVVAALTGCSKSNPEAARASAKEFAANIPGATGSTCTEVDSDGDGYCGCTIFRGEKDPVAIECGCEAHCIWNCIRGCKTVDNLKMLNRK